MEQADEVLQSQVGGTIEDVTSSTNAYILNRHLILFGTVSGICVIASAFLSFGIYLLYQSAPQTFDARIIIVPLLPLFAIVYFYRYYRSRVEHLFVEQIATALGYAYTADIPAASVAVGLLAIGHSQKAYDAISGIYHSYPVRIFTYRYTVGYGRNSHTYTKAVFELTYTGDLPHLMLKPASWSTEFGSTSGMAPVNLEGDFGKYFSLSAGDDAQIQAREVFEPDVMQELIQDFSGYSCELIGAKMYLTRTGPIYKREEFMALHELADEFTDKVLPGLRSASEDEAAEGSVKATQAVVS